MLGHASELPQNLILPFDPFMAFQETIAMSGLSHSLIKGYEELTDMLINSNASDVLTLLNDATKLREAGNTELADMKYREIVETKPESWEAWTEAGIYQKMRGNSPEALNSFKHAFELSPTSTRVIAQLAFTTLELNQVEEAQTYANRLIEQNPDPKELSQLGDLSNVVSYSKPRSSCIKKRPSWILAGVRRLMWARQQWLWGAMRRRTTTTRPRYKLSRLW